MKTNHPMNGATAVAKERIPVFDLPHKGIRNALSQLSLLAGQTDYTTFASVDRLYKLGKMVFRFLTLHALDENEVTFKHLDTRVPGATEHERDDHERLEALQYTLEQQLENLHMLASEGQDVSEQGPRFYQLFSELHGMHLAHMLEEEREVQPQIYAHFSDEEILEQRKEIIGKNKPEDLLIMWRFMLPAFSQSTRTDLLKAFKGGMPEPAFAAIMATLKEVLTEGDMKHLESALA